MSKTKKNKNIISIISDFISKVKVEIKKIVWTSKSNLLKFSIATLSFMIFICVFFVATDLLISLISYVKELIG